MGEGGGGGLLLFSWTIVLLTWGVITSVRTNTSPIIDNKKIAIIYTRHR